MPLQVLHSFVHAGHEKVTSMTISMAEDAVIITMSDKIDKIRAKIDIDELAGLSAAVAANQPWTAFHSFEKEGVKTETRISYRDFFFNVEGTKKIALKLTPDEKASFARVLGVAFDYLVMHRPQMQQ